MSIEGRADVQEQRDYYERTAAEYDSMHVHAADEHGRALGAFMGLAEVFGPVDSVLDVGAGTGRALQTLKARWPNTRVLGIEPVGALRDVGYKKGIPADELIGGDALKLDLDDNEFDYVIETGILHHIADPSIAIREMIRVARKGVMFSDSNNIGQGPGISRAIKYIVKCVGLWTVFVWVQTRGKMYKVSEGDGIYYSFSVYDYKHELRAKFPNIYYLNTSNLNGYNLYRGGSHAMVFATKAL